MGMHTCRVLNLVDPGQRIQGMINGRKIDIKHGQATNLSDTVINSLRTSTQVKWNENVTAYTEEPSYDIQIIEYDDSVKQGETDKNRKVSEPEVSAEETKDIPEPEEELPGGEAEIMADLEEE